MRHWNIILFFFSLFSLFHFYSTYEALKQNIYRRRKCSWVYFYSTYEALKLSCPSTYTLNSFHYFYSTYEALKRLGRATPCYPYSWFLLYLWGIETNLLKVRMAIMYHIFTLPMRHWNWLLLIFPLIRLLHFYSTYEALKLFLLPLLLLLLCHFYSTYEALKRRLRRILKRKKNNFYSTYEALKHRCFSSSFIASLNFYSTYEALKLLSI